MQTHNSSCSNQKSEDHMDSEECCTNQSTTNPYMHYRQTSSRILNQQGSTATTIRCVDSDLVIHNSAAQLPTIDRLEAVAQSAVSFESTQSHKPPSHSHDCLDVEPVQRAVSEPPASFLAAVRQAWLCCGESRGVARRNTPHGITSTRRGAHKTPTYIGLTRNDSTHARTHPLAQMHIQQKSVWHDTIFCLISLINGICESFHNWSSFPLQYGSGDWFRSSM